MRMVRRLHGNVLETNRKQKRLVGYVPDQPFLLNLAIKLLVALLLANTSLLTSELT